MRRRSSLVWRGGGVERRGRKGDYPWLYGFCASAAGGGPAGQRPRRHARRHARRHGPKGVYVKHRASAHAPQVVVLLETEECVHERWRASPPGRPAAATIRKVRCAAAPSCPHPPPQDALATSAAAADAGCCASRGRAALSRGALHLRGHAAGAARLPGLPSPGLPYHTNPIHPGTPPSARRRAARRSGASTRR